MHALLYAYSAIEVCACCKPDTYAVSNNEREDKDNNKAIIVTVTIKPMMMKATRTMM